MRIGIGRDRFDVGPWQGDAATAYLNTARPGDQIDPQNLTGCLERLRSWGFSAVVTSALHPEETQPFITNGFRDFDSLTVLSHPLHGMPSPVMPLADGLRLRRAKRGDLGTVFRVDERAFPPNWRIDALGVEEARRATTRSRFRVVERSDADVSGVPVGYAITGRTGRMGFLQRLATDPDWSGQGIGSALVIDALRWAARGRCSRLLVNTQFTNRRALALYENLGFIQTATRLTVLRCSL